MIRQATSNDELVTAHALAQLVSEPYHTIDHWAARELLVFRRRGRARQFPLAENRRRCERIRFLQNEGHSLTTIKGLLTQASPKEPK